MPPTTRSYVAVAVMLVAAAALVGFTLLRSRTKPTSPDVAVVFPAVTRGTDAAAIAAQPHLLSLRASGSDQATTIELAPLGDASAPRAATSLSCDRISFAAGRGICLQTHAGLMTTYEAVLFDVRFQPYATLKLQGAPSRTRVSPDGRLGATTVFVTGQEHGYNSVSFSTRTTLVDMAAGRELGDLEQFTAVRDGQPFSAKDFNFWGVTFTHDSNVFFATLMTGSKTYLVRGDVAARSMTVLRDNVECPAISPDDTRLAFKKRVGGDRGPWHFYVLDLATMTETPIVAEARPIDDQLEWFDASHVLYAATRSSQSAIEDVWIAPVSGTGPARPLLSEASSPIVVR